LNISFKGTIIWTVLIVVLLILISPLSTVSVEGDEPPGRPTVDFTSCEFTYPFPIVNGELNITGTATDPNGTDDIESVTIAIGPIEPLDKYDVGPHNVIGTPNWYFLWDSREVSDGDYRITAKVTDKDGHNHWAFCNITVKNTDAPPPEAPQEESNENWFLENWYFSVIIAVVISILAFLIIFIVERRFRRKKAS
jgi:heme/copper-type cytochrome/quinol oxidase subunit 2